MPELPDKPTVPLEGVVLPSIAPLSEMLEQVIQINSGQLLEAVNKLNELARVYGNFAIQTTGVLNTFVKQQEQIAETLAIFTKKLSLFDNIDLFIKSSLISDIVETNALATRPSPVVQVFIQPSNTLSIQLPKALPAPKRKQQLPLSTVTIQEDGFVHNGVYIKGMTKGSQVGMLFELFIDQNLAGIIPDELIDKVLHISPGDYQARDYVLRDLKEVLQGNKLELNLERYRGLKQYKLFGITKRIRKSKKQKKLNKTNKSN